MTITAPAATKIATASGPAQSCSSSTTAPRIPAAMTEPNDAADIAEPNDAAEATERPDAAEPIEPTESTEPTDPIESSEPFDAIERHESFDQRLSVEPSSIRGSFPRGATVVQPYLTFPPRYASTQWKMQRVSPRQPFQAFLDEHRSAVLGFLRALVGPVDADDCFQETFMAAMRNYETLEGGNPRAWVMTIARNKAIDHHRSVGRRATPRGDDLPDMPAPPRRQPDPGLWAEVASLPRRQREAVALRFAADLRYREIANAMDTSEEAARRSVHEGLKKLRERLSEEAL